MLSQLKLFCIQYRVFRFFKADPCKAFIAIGSGKVGIRANDGRRSCTNYHSVSSRCFCKGYHQIANILLNLYVSLLFVKKAKKKSRSFRQCNGFLLCRRLYKRFNKMISFSLGVEPFLGTNLISLSSFQRRGIWFSRTFSAWSFPR